MANIGPEFEAEHPSTILSGLAMVASKHDIGSS